MEEYKPEVKLQIQEILNQTFEIRMDLLQDDKMNFSELDLDSLDVADMIVALEQKTGTQIKITAFLNVKTMSDLYQAVSKYY